MGVGRTVGVLVGVDVSVGVGGGVLVGVLVGVSVGLGRGRAVGCGLGVQVDVGVDVGGMYTCVGEGDGERKRSSRSSQSGVALISYRTVGFAVGSFVGLAVEEGVAVGEAVGVCVTEGGAVGVSVGVIVVGVDVVVEAPLQLIELAPSEIPVASNARAAAVRPTLSRRSICA